MAKQIPLNFEEHWKGADVILRTQNSNGKELHAEKATLAGNSSYFKAMFFSGFKEAFQDYVDVPCDYECMVKILQIIHGIKNDLKDVTAVEELAEMFRTADMLDFTMIREMCIEKLEADLMTAALVAVKLGVHEMIMEYLEKMSCDELKQFLAFQDKYPLFSKKDVLWLYGKMVGKKLPKSPYVPEKAGIVRKLEEMALEIENLSTDLTKQGKASDVTIETRNSDGRLLYSNKEVLSKFSEQLHKMFISSNSVNEALISLDVDYTTMKAILSVLHQCEVSTRHLPYSDTVACFYFHELHPILLYDMYRAAEKFDIPLVKKCCVDILAKQTTVRSLEIAIKLDLPDLIANLLEKMIPNEVRDWVHSGDKDLIYSSDNKEIILSSNATDPTLSLCDVRLAIAKLCEKFPPSNGRGKLAITFPIGHYEPYVPREIPHYSAYRVTTVYDEDSSYLGNRLRDISSKFRRLRLYAPSPPPFHIDFPPLESKHAPSYWYDGW